MKFTINVLLAGDKFMSEIHLKQPVFIYSTCGPFTKNKERIQKFREIGEKQNIFTEMTDLQIKLVFSMIWLMEILKVQQEEQPLMKF